MSSRTARRSLIQLVLLALSLGATGTALAQKAKWPAKPIRIVVAFPPGA